MIRKGKEKKVYVYLCVSLYRFIFLSFFGIPVLTIFLKSSTEYQSQSAKRKREKIKIEKVQQTEYVIYVYMYVCTYIS